MGCKHKDVIRVVNNKPQYFCKVFKKEITEYKCRNCMLKIEDTNNEINQLFGKIFGKGYSV